VRGVNLGHQDLEDFIFRHLEIGDFRAEALNDGGNDSSSSPSRSAKAPNPPLLRDALDQGEGNLRARPQVVVLETGTLAKEFEANVKAARFVDRR